MYNIFGITYRRFITAQLLIISLILLLGFVGYLLEHFEANYYLRAIFHFFDVGREQSIPTYFSILNLLLASLLLFIISVNEKEISKKMFWYWLLLGFIFLSLSVDESVTIHEKFTLLQQYLQNNKFVPRMMDTHEWIPFGVLFVIVFGIVFIPFLKLIDKKTALYFSIAGAVFVTGAIGFEYLGSVMLKTGFVQTKNELIYMIRRIFEEGFEMYGIAIFNIALYREILRREIKLILKANSSLTK